MRYWEHSVFAVFGLDHGVGHLASIPTTRRRDSGCEAPTGACGVQQRLQILCDLASTTGLPSTGIFTLRMACSAMRTSQAMLRSPGGQMGVRTLASFGVPHVANAVIRARCFLRNSETREHHLKHDDMLLQ